jgi:HK97 family phage major capsid protein
MPFTATTTNSAAAWRPDQFAFSPSDVIPEALILQCSTQSGVVEGDAPACRVAFVDDDEAQFTAEGADIDEGNPALSEVTIFTAKVTQLVRLSNEQFSQDGTAEQLAASVGRAVTRRADLAFVSETAPTPPALAPAAGLVNVTGIVEGDPVSGSLDALVDLIATLQSNLSTPTHILTDPLGWAELRKLKTGNDFNSSLLGAGTTDALPMLLSLPVIVSPAVPMNSGVVIDQSAVVSAVGPLVVATSTDRYFDSDSVALRATWRCGHAVVRPDRIGIFDIAAAGS